MAARKNRGVGNLPGEWKDKIRASALVNRLMECAMGELEMSQQQIKSAEILLKKVIPDLNKTDIQPLGKDGLPTDAIVHEIRISHVDTRPSDTESV